MSLGFAQAPVGFMDCFVGQTENAFTSCGIFFRGVAARQKSVVGVEGRVQQVLAVEFLKDERLQQQCGRLRSPGWAAWNRVKSLTALG